MFLLISFSIILFMLTVVYSDKVFLFFYNLYKMIPEKEPQMSKECNSVIGKHLIIGEKLVKVERITHLEHSHGYNINDKHNMSVSEVRKQLKLVDKK